MSSIKLHKIYFVKASNGQRQIDLDIIAIVELLDVYTTQQLLRGLGKLLVAIEQQGIQSIYAHKVSPDNDAWFVFFDNVSERKVKRKIAVYAFVDEHKIIHIYHANRQDTPSPELSLLSKGMRIAKPR